MSENEKMDLGALRITRPKRDYARAGGGGGSWLGWLAVLILAIALLHPRSPARIWGDPGVPVVQTMTVSQDRPRPDTVKGMAANGHVVAARRAALSADTPGRIVELSVTEGSQVSQGEVVARLYAEEYAAQLARAQAAEHTLEAERTRIEAEVELAQRERTRLESLQEAQAAETRARGADLTLAKQEAERASKLAERGASDQRELDRVQSALAAARARVAQAQALEEGANRDLSLADARIELARRQLPVLAARQQEARAQVELAAATLEKTRVRAPFTGVVVLKDAEVGEVVSPNVAGGASSRGAIVTMVDLASLEVQAEVPETRLRSVRPEGPVRIFLDSDPETPHPGVVSRIWPTANRQKATIEVRVRFLDPPPGLRPEMGVRAVFLPEGSETPSETTGAAEAQEPPRLEIPERCLTEQDGTPGVWLLVAGQAHFRAIQTGESKRGMVEVRDGLQDGEQVVLAPPPGLTEGCPLRLLEP